MRNVCKKKHHQQGDGERQLFAAAARGNFRSALPRWSFYNLAPLLVVQLPQFELRVSEDGALELGLVHSPAWHLYRLAVGAAPGWRSPVPCSFVLQKLLRTFCQK
jgi:hypothetical protein